MPVAVGPKRVRGPPLVAGFPDGPKVILNEDPKSAGTPLLRPTKSPHTALPQNSGYAIAIISAREEERRRISLGLHDIVGQNLTALSLGLRALATGPVDAPNLGMVHEMEKLVDTITLDVHDLALELRPAALDGLGLVRSLEDYLCEWSSRTSVPAKLYSTLERSRLPFAVEITLYRILLEALHNIAKHAQAKQVSIIVEQRCGQAVAIIEDDGIGFDAARSASPPIRPQLGILAMTERATFLGGTVTIESIPSRGTTLIVRIPIVTG